MKWLGTVTVGLFLACWAVFLLQLLGATRLPELRSVTLSQAYSAASALGWFAGMIYVLHAFQKKSKKGIATPKQEIELIKRRLKAAREHAKGETHD